VASAVAVETLWINWEKATPVAEEQAPPRERCRAVHIDTGTAMPGAIDSYLSTIRNKWHLCRTLAEAKQFQSERNFALGMMAGWG
jgi:hypothetical protein